MITILIMFHLGGYKYLKYFYINYICKHCTHLFPKTVSYNRFVELERKVAAPMLLFVKLPDLYNISYIGLTLNNVSDNYRRKMLRTSIYEWKYDYVSAIVEYNNIEKEYGFSRELYYYKSICYNEIGDTDRAVAEITKYLEMVNGNDYYVLAQRADYYRKAGLYDEAIIDFSKMVDIAPMDAYAYFLDRNDEAIE